MATCDPQALLNSANCFDCLTNQQLEQVQVQMLCDLVNGGLAGGPFVRISEDTMTGGLAIKSSSGLVVGSAFGGVNTPPASGLIVEGNVGLGTATPTSELEVFDDAHSGILRLSRDAGGLRGTLEAGRNNGGAFQTCYQMTMASTAGGNTNGVCNQFVTDNTGTLVNTFQQIASNGVGVAWSVGKFGVGTSAPKSNSDFYDNVTIGQTYAGVNAAPTSGLIVEGRVGFGTNAPNANALLDLVSTTLGFKLPTMTTAQKNLIANTAGLMVFDTDLGKACVNSGAGWQTITSV